MSDTRRLDALIVDQLRRDGRASIRDLAEALGVPESTARDHLHHLEETGAIRGYRPDVDLRRLGLHVTFWVTLRAPEHNERALREALSGEAAVIRAHPRPDAPACVFALMAFRDIAAADRFLAGLQSSLEVEASDLCLVDDLEAQPIGGEQAIEETLNNLARQ